MKKISKLFSLGLIAVTLVGCSCKKGNNVEYKLKDSENVLESNATSLSLTTQEIYNYIRENESKEVNTVFLKYLMGTVLNIEGNDTNKTIYDLKVKKHFEKEYLEKSEYKVNGVFSEDLLVAKLESQLYIVDKVNKPTSGVTYDLGLRYNYSDYIERALNYDVYLEMLKGQYIMEQRPDIIDDSRTRIISIYTDSKLDDIMEIIDELAADKYDDLEDLAASKKKLEIEEIGKQYCTELGLENDYYVDDEGNKITDCSIGSKNNSTYDGMLKKFTTCENDTRCDLKDGLAHQIKLINEKTYIETKVVNKNTTDILYEAALKQLFRENVDDYLHTFVDGEDPFLADWIYNHSEEFSKRDIILTDGPEGTSKKYYLVTVRVVDSKTQSLEDKEEAISLLLDRVSETTVLTHYLKDLKVNVVDPEIKEYYDALLGR